jgi:3-methyladenine DNA glycosylase AlkD
LTDKEFLVAKAINWPLPFRDEVLAEDSEQERIALRVGSLYYDNRYWVPDEVVDIRVNHKKVRLGRVVGDLRQCPICELSTEDFKRLKKPLQNQQAVIDFLAETYNQPVNMDTLVTIVTYQNHPVIQEEIET